MSLVERRLSSQETVSGAFQDLTIRTGLFLLGSFLVNRVNPDKPDYINFATVTSGVAIALLGVFKPFVSDIYYGLKDKQRQNKENIIFSQQNTNGGGI